MRPLPEESLPLKKSRPAQKSGDKEIRRLADRLIAYTDVDRDNNSDVYDLLEETRRRLLQAHARRQAKKKRKN